MKQNTDVKVLNIQTNGRMIENVRLGKKVKLSDHMSFDEIGKLIIKAQHGNPRDSVRK